MALCPGLPGQASSLKVKPIWILLKQESEWQWHQLGHMQVCTSLQTDNHASTAPVSFYRPDALPAAHPTASKQWRHSTEGFWTLDVLRWWCGVCELEWCGVYSCSRRFIQRPACDWRVQWPTYRHVTHCTAPVPPLTTTMMTVMTSTHC